MAFFRIKTIKRKEYAYIVENTWKGKASRQKVKNYIGRAYRFDLKSSVDFAKFLDIDRLEDYVSNNEKNKIVNDLIEWEFHKFGISKEEFSLDLINRKIQKNKRGIVLVINDGFMCSHTLKKMLDFKAEGDEETDGYRLARAFVEAGIKVPQEVFIGLFGKLYKVK